MRKTLTKARARLATRARLDRSESLPSRIGPLEASVGQTLDATLQLSRELQEMRALLEEHHDVTQREFQRLKDILEVIYDQEPEARKNLRSMRASAEYQRAFTDPEPLVSVPIATYDRGHLLVTRAIPSVLSQSYANVEVVVVGDAAPAETAELIKELGDPRVRYVNLPHRGPYPENPRDGWHVHGVTPRNEAVARARGQWIAPLDDDDAFHPNHVRDLLSLAQERRCEVAYGLLRCLMNDGSEFNLGAFPPRLGHFGWQGAIFHAQLRFFEMDLAAWLFFSPADWSLCRRMLRAGVTFAMMDEVVTDHYESRIDPEYESTTTA